MTGVKCCVISSNSPKDDPFLPNVDDIVEACPELLCIEENKDEDEDVEIVFITIHRIDQS